MKEQIIKVLNNIKEGVDYENSVSLIDDGRLTSLDIIQLIGELDDEFDISIPASDIIPENFNSVDAMVKLVETLQDE